MRLRHAPNESITSVDRTHLVGLFQPNARGAREFRSLDGFGQRQILISRGHHVGERVLIVVGVDEVAIWSVVLGIAVRQLERMPRGDVLGFPIEPIGPSSPEWPAFMLVDLRRARLIAELRAVTDDPSSRSVAAALGPTDAADLVTNRDA